MKAPVFYQLAHSVLQLRFPKFIIWKLYRPLINLRFRRFLKKRLGPYCRPVEPAPTPPRELVLKTCAATRESFEMMFKRGYGFTDRYHSVGQGVILKWLGYLEGHGFNIRTMGAVLDFGCGTGRLLQHFRQIEGLRIVGADVNPNMTAWCAKNISGIEFHNNSLEPPLDFAEDNSFDLVYALSVFTHIPIELQRPWLAEMRRILRPGGFLLCTMFGLWYMKLFLNDKAVEQMKRDGFLQYTSNDKEAHLATQAEGPDWDIYQCRSEVIRVFGSELKLLDYIPGHQDLLILKKEGPSVM